MSLRWFGDKVRDHFVDRIGALAENAGRHGVEVAQQHVPVRTGRLHRSIGFYWDRKALRLTLFADEPYAAWVEIHTPYLRVGAAAMGMIFGSRSEVQFATLPEQYRNPVGDRLRNRRATLGHRKPRRNKH